MTQALRLDRHADERRPEKRNHTPEWTTERPGPERDGPVEHQAVVVTHAPNETTDWIEGPNVHSTFFAHFMKGVAPTWSRMFFRAAFMGRDRRHKSSKAVALPSPARHQPSRTSRCSSRQWRWSMGSMSFRCSRYAPGTTRSPSDGATDERHSHDSKTWRSNGARPVDVGRVDGDGTGRTFGLVERAPSEPDCRRTTTLSSPCRRGLRAVGRSGIETVQ